MKTAPFTPASGFASLDLSWKREYFTQPCGRKERTATTACFTTLHVADKDGNRLFDLSRAKGEFTIKNHGTGNYCTGGHNWYMTTRFDVWFNHPDGYLWWGYCITSHWACAEFRIRRTRSSWVAESVCRHLSIESGYNRRHPTRFNPARYSVHQDEDPVFLQIVRHPDDRARVPGQTWYAGLFQDRCFVGPDKTECVARAITADGYLCSWHGHMAQAA